jgi:hypothetical protein
MTIYIDRIAKDLAEWENFSRNGYYIDGITENFTE